MRSSRLARAALVPTLLVTLCAAPALAQISPEFARVLAHPDEQKMVVAAARQSSVILENPCADGRFSIANSIAIITPPEFDQQGRLLSGTWKQVLRYEGCDAARTLNVLMTFVQGQNPSARPLFPGATRASAQLQADVFLSPSMRLFVDRWRQPECRTVYVVDTVGSGSAEGEVPGDASQAWRETWTIAACEQARSMSIRFVPDATGVAFVIDLTTDKR